MAIEHYYIDTSKKGMHPFLDKAIDEYKHPKKGMQESYIYG